MKTTFIRQLLFASFLIVLVFVGTSTTFRVDSTDVVTIVNSWAGSTDSSVGNSTGGGGDSDWGSLPICSSCHVGQAIEKVVNVPLHNRALFSKFEYPITKKTILKDGHAFLIIESNRLALYESNRSSGGCSCNRGKMQRVALFPSGTIVLKDSLERLIVVVPDTTKYLKRTD